MKKRGLLVLGASLLLGLVGCNGSGEAPYVNDDGYWVVNGEVTDVNVNDEKYKVTVTVKSVEKTSGDGLVDTYTITFSDGSTFTYTITNGKDGEKGESGENGKDGVSPTITIGENGNWYINGVDSGVSAYGEKGSDGKDGTNGENGKDGRSVTSIGKTSTNGNIDTYTITYNDGTTSTFTVTNGVDGENAPHYGEEFTVTFDANEGTLPDGYESSVIVEWGDTLDLPTPTYVGYTFLGWYTGTSANDSKFSNKDAVFSNLDLIAIYDEIHYEFPAELELVDGSTPKEYYLYGETVTVKAKASDNKTFDHFVNHAGGNDYRIETTYTFGGDKNYKEIVYREEASLSDGFEGAYIGSITVDGEEIAITLIYDGYGYFILNGEKWSLYALANGEETTYYTGLNENLFVESLSDPFVTFEGGSFHKDETFKDGNTYSYFEATETNLTNGKTIKLWKDGKAYIEATNFKYKGTITGTVTSGDYEGSKVDLIFGSDGNGIMYVDEIEETSWTYVEETTSDDGSTVYSFTDEYDESATITVNSTGEIIVKYGDYRSFTATYSYPWYGKFTGTDNSNESEIEISFDETGVGSLTIDGYASSAKFYIESYTLSYITVYNETEDTTYKITISGSSYSGRVSDEMTKTTLSFTSSYKAACAIAGTYNGEDDDGYTYQVVINEDYSGKYFEDGTQVLSFTVEANDDGTYTATDTDGETYKITVTTSGLRVRFGDSAINYTKA